MRKIVVRDYKYIGEEMERLSNITSNEIDEDDINDDLVAYSINGMSADSSYSISCDVKVLSKQLIRYFELTCKGFIFESFYDKKFTDAFKSLIKTPDEFERFLEMIHLDAEEFIHIAIYISPQSFTSNLIKFLKENYLK